jgi:hypothetical protein
MYIRARMVRGTGAYRTRYSPRERERRGEREKGKERRSESERELQRGRQTDRKGAKSEGDIGHDQPEGHQPHEGIVVGCA